MSLSSIIRTAHRSIVSCVLPTIGTLGGVQNIATRSINTLCKNNTKIVPKLLVGPSLPLINAVRGMKTKGWLNLRCKDCYFVLRQGRRHVMCKTHPRHKQQAVVKKEKNTWIMTHFTNGKRAWPLW